MKWIAESLIAIFLLFSLTFGSSVDYDFFELGANKLPIRVPPKYLKPCRKSDKEINRCIKSSLDTLFEHIRTGSKELNLKGIDPLEVPLLEVTEGSGNASLQMTFKNLQILGLGHMQILNVRSNLVDNKFEITIKTPYLDMVGQYSGEGGIMSFPISGHGEFYLNLTDVSAAWIIYLAQSDEFQGHTYYMIDQFLIDIIPSDISAHFGENIDGDNRIGSAFNLFFNENAHEIFKTVKPKISEALSNIFGNIANQILSRYPAEVLLPP